MKKRWIAPGVSLAIFVLFVLAHKNEIATSQNELPKGDAPEGQSIASSDSSTSRTLSAVKKEPAAATAAATSDDQAKLELVDSILASKNDNDPRLDKELKVLSEGSKELLRDRYREFAAERFNEKGTLVFLLGRNLSTMADFAFLNDVLAEPPCLSLESCDKMSGSPQNPADQHQDIGNEVTLAYPQLVALKSIERFLFNTPASKRTQPLEDRAVQSLRSATQSKVQKVATLASSLLARWQDAKN